MQVEERKLRKEIREREEKVVAGLLKSANVVCTTNVGAASKVLQRLFGGGGKRKGGEEAPPLFFDLVVIDEAAQAVEVSSPVMCCPCA